MELLLYSIIALIILMSVIIFIIIWGWRARNSNRIASGIIPLTSPVSGEYRCSDFTCDTGYTCDSVSQLCKKNVGEPCVLGSECLNGSYCSGRCVIDPPAYVTLKTGDPCPCSSDMECILSDDSVLYYCKYAPGHSCSSNSECSTGSCINNICSSGTAAGGSCTVSSNCAKGLYCSIGYCQPTGINTGDVGATCNTSNGPGCNSGNACVNSICIAASAGMGDSCNLTDVTCSAPLTCVDGDQFSICDEDSGYCICTYPSTNESTFYYPNPNSSIYTSTCTIDNTPNPSKICVGNMNQPCSVNSDCDSNSCSSSPSIYRISFVSPVSENPLNPTPYIISSTNMNYELMNSAPSNVQSLLGYSIGSVDYVYYTITGSNGGLYTSTGIEVISGTINSFTNDPIATTITQIFIDAILINNSLGYVLFNETHTTTTSQTNKTVYSFNPTSNPVVFTVFNPQSGSGILGTQYYGATALNPTRLHANSNGDLLLLDSGFIYVKPSTLTTYSRLVTSDPSNSTTVTNASLPKFYNGNIPNVNDSSPTCTLYCKSNVNVSYINHIVYNYNGVVYDIGNVVVFNGTLYGYVTPLVGYNNGTGDDVNAYIKFTVYDYDTYDEIGSESQSGYTIMVAMNNNNNRMNLYIGMGGTPYWIPGHFNINTRVLALKQGTYVYSTGNCQ